MAVCLQLVEVWCYDESTGEFWSCRLMVKSSGCRPEESGFDSQWDRLIKITMVIMLNSVHKRIKSPPHCGGRQGETIADYLDSSWSHDQRNSGYSAKGA